MRLLTLATLYAIVTAKVPYYWSEAYQTLFACNLQILQYGDYCNQTWSYNNWPCPCTNLEARASIAGCLQNANLFSEEYFEPFFAMCSDNNVSVLSEDMSSALAYYNNNATEYPVIIAETRGRILTKPVLLPVNATDQYTRSMCKFLDNFNISTYYGTGMLAYWVLIIILGALANWTKLLFPGLMRDLNGRFSIWVRKYITLPAVRGKKTNSTSFAGIFQMLTPSRYESLVVGIFIVLVVVLIAVDVNPPVDDPIFPLRSVGTLRFVAGRCAVSAGMIVPLLIIFALRNNMLIWFTHWNYGTFLMFHRWIGRVVFCLVAIHAITFSLSMDSIGVIDYQGMMSRDYMIAGTLATIAAGIIIFQGFLVLRRSKYEVFVLCHILLALAFIVGSWGHVQRFNHHQPYVAATAIWAFDRVIRIVRLIWFGAPKAELMLVADETIRVTIPTRKHWHPTPGGHAFVYFWRPSCWWQSHPFTFNQSVVSSNKVVFYCKVKGGMTHGLYQHLKKCPEQTDHIRVSVEGPYGGASPVKRYDNAIYVAGGNGVPGPYYEAYNLARKHPEAKQTIRLFWVIREYQLVLWFYQELLALRSTKIDVVVYVTKPNSIPFDYDEFRRVKSGTSKLNIGLYASDSRLLLSVGSLSYESYSKSGKGETREVTYEKFSNYKTDKVLEQMKRDLFFVRFIEGRPSMNELVDTTIKTTEGSIGFVTCGHPIMVDDLRQACINHLDVGPRIDFFEHLQIWA